jgi:hypothetical protein
MKSNLKLLKATRGHNNILQGKKSEILDFPVPLADVHLEEILDTL